MVGTHVEDTCPAIRFGRNASVLPDADDVPQNHDVHKTAELVSKTSAHALVDFAESKNSVSTLRLLIFTE